MKTVKVTLYPGAETAYLLRKLLGPLREWSDFLADCRQGKTSLHGCTLLPYAQVHDGRRDRPHYRAGDIAKFVKELREKRPDLKPVAKAQHVIAEFPVGDGRIWKLRKLGLTDIERAA